MYENMPHASGCTCHICTIATLRAQLAKAQKQIAKWVKVAEDAAYADTQVAALAIIDAALAGEEE